MQSGGKGTAVFVPQSPSNTQADRAPVVFGAFLALPFAGSLAPPKAPACPPAVRGGRGCRGPGASAPSSRGRRALAPRRRAERAVGVAARRRAPPRRITGPGGRRKETCWGRRRGPRAGGRARERAREERVHFCPGVSETRSPRARASEHRGSGSASSEEPGEGSRRRDRSAPAGRGAREAGQRGEPRGARPGAAQDAARRAAVAATAPLRLDCGR